jgi:pyruvate/2-oxoglutarate dehydrogenase complex dihydrolipoamide dehydrogenase (E3) component
MNSLEESYMEYDAIVIGSGQGGTPLASALAGAKLHTALIERDEIGGTCINYGCTPTKTMVASAQTAYKARRAADYGIHTGSVSVDMQRVRQRKRDIVESFRSGSERRVSQAEGLDLIRGDAQFTGPKALSVSLNGGGKLALEASRIFIDTGTRSARPKLEGLDTIAWLDSTSIMELDEVPQDLVVLGGGYVGLEFGQMFRRFGSQVTIVNRGPQVLNREDKDVAEEVLKILREDGIEVLLKAEAERVTKQANGFEITVSGSEKRLVRGSHLLVATGRVPNTEDLNLEAAGVKTDAHGFIRVNDRLETTAEGVYALGDVKGGSAFTHISYDDFRIVRANLLEGKSASIAGRLLPYTVYIDPQLGRIGPTEQELRAAGRDIAVAKMPMSYVARALETDESRGFIKAVVDKETKQILGAAVFGMEGGEVAAMLQIAMMGKLPYPALRDGVFTHPALAESLNNLFASLP